MIAMSQLDEMRRPEHTSRTRRSTNITGRSTVFPAVTEPEHVSSEVTTSPDRRCRNATRTHIVPEPVPEFVKEHVSPSSPPASQATRRRGVPLATIARQPTHEAPPTRRTTAARAAKAAMIPQPMPQPVENALRGGV
jgi:hypothetical protein